MQGHSRNFFSRFLSRTVASADAQGQQLLPDRYPGAPENAAAPEQDLPQLPGGQSVLLPGACPAALGTALSPGEHYTFWQRAAPLAHALQETNLLRSGSSPNVRSFCLCSSVPPVWEKVIVPYSSLLSHHTDGSAVLTLPGVSSKLKRSRLRKFSLEGSSTAPLTFQLPAGKQHHARSAGAHRAASSTVAVSVSPAFGSTPQHPAPLQSAFPQHFARCCDGGSGSSWHLMEHPQWHRDLFHEWPQPSHNLTPCAYTASRLLSHISPRVACLPFCALLPVIFFYFGYLYYHVMVSS